MINFLVVFAFDLIFQPAGVNSGFSTKYVANRILSWSRANCSAVTDVTADMAETNIVQLSIIIQNRSLKKLLKLSTPLIPGLYIINWSNDCKQLDGTLCFKRERIKMILSVDNKLERQAQYLRISSKSKVTEHHASKARPTPNCMISE